MIESAQKPLGPRVRIEQGPVRNFAAAMLDSSAAYQKGDLTGVVVPPTFPAVMEHWGRIDDLPGGPPPARKPRTGLHGEMELVYHRPVRVGDVLAPRERPVESVEREGRRGGKMRFETTATDWCDADGTPVVTVRSTMILMDALPPA